MDATLRPGDLSLVTGGSGFLGSAVVRTLIERGARALSFAAPAHAAISTVSMRVRS